MQDIKACPGVTNLGVCLQCSLANLRLVTDFHFRNGEDTCHLFKEMSNTFTSFNKNKRGNLATIDKTTVLDRLHFKSSFAVGYMLLLWFISVKQTMSVFDI